MCSRRRSNRSACSTTIPRKMRLSSIQCRFVRKYGRMARIGRAKRPVIFAGSGVRHGDALDEFGQVIRALQIPVVTAWTQDIIASDDPLFCGRPGTIGERAGNFTVQNADLVAGAGSRLNIRQISYNWKSFARHAVKIQVDIDEAELLQTSAATRCTHPLRRKTISCRNGAAARRPCGAHSAIMPGSLRRPSGRRGIPWSSCINVWMDLRSILTIH